MLSDFNRLLKRSEHHCLILQSFSWNECDYWGFSCTLESIESLLYGVHFIAIGRLQLILDLQSEWVFWNSCVVKETIIILHCTCKLVIMDKFWPLWEYPVLVIFCLWRIELVWYLENWEYSLEKESLDSLAFLIPQKFIRKFLTKFNLFFWGGGGGH